MSKPPQTYEEISQLAAHEQPGALSVAEQSIDRHMDLLTSNEEKLNFLDALSRDLFSLGETKPELINFLQQMQSYIDLTREQISS